MSENDKSIASWFKNIFSSAKIERKAFEAAHLEKIFDFYDENKNHVLEGKEIRQIRKEIRKKGVDQTVNKLKTSSVFQCKGTERQDFYEFLTILKDNGGKIREKQIQKAKPQKTKKEKKVDVTKTANGKVCVTKNGSKKYVQDGKVIKTYAKNKNGEFVEATSLTLTDEEYKDQQNYEATLSEDQLDEYNYLSTIYEKDITIQNGFDQNTQTIIYPYQKIKDYQADRQQAKAVYDNFTKRSYKGNLETQNVKTCFSNSNIKMVITNSGLWLINEATGQFIEGAEYESALKKEASAIAKKLVNATKKERPQVIKKCLAKIKSAKLKDYVNQELAKLDDKYKESYGKSPLELYLDKKSDGRSSYIQNIKQLAYDDVNWQTSVTYDEVYDEESIEDAAEVIYQELEYELHGGLGITNKDNVEKILNTIDMYNAPYVAQKIKENHPEFNLKETDTIAACIKAMLKTDFTNNNKIDRLISKLYQNEAVVLDETAQAEKDKLVNDLLNSDKESSFKAALSMMSFIPDDFAEQNGEETIAGVGIHSTDYTTLQNYAKKQIGDAEPLVDGQSEIEQLLVQRCKNRNGKIDFGRLDVYHESLYKGNTPITVQAQTIILKVRQGDEKALFETSDERVCKELNRLISNGELSSCKKFKDCHTLQACFNKIKKELFEDSSLLPQLTNAAVSGYITLTDKEYEDLALNLINILDTLEMKKFTSENSKDLPIYDGTDKNDYNRSITSLKNLLSFLAVNHPETYNKITPKIKESSFNFTEANGVTHNQRQIYQDMIASTNTKSEEQIYLDSNGKVIDKEKYSQIQQEYTQITNLYKNYIARLEHTYNNMIHKEGILSDIANTYTEGTGFGTDREDVKNKFREAKIILRDMELAAQGKLRDSSGKIVSIDDLLKKLDDLNIEDEFGSYSKTIMGWKTGMLMTAAMLLTYGASELLAPWMAAASAKVGGDLTAYTFMRGGLSVGQWALRGAVGATSALISSAGVAGLNLLEMGTSDEGIDQEKMAKLGKELMVNFATSTLTYGASIASYAVKFSSQICTSVARLAILLAADTGATFGAEYIKTGKITLGSGMILTVTFAIAGNIVAIKQMNIAHGSNIEIVENGQKLSDIQVLEKFENMQDELAKDARKILNWKSMTREDKVLNARLYLLGNQSRMHNVVLPLPGTRGKGKQVFSLTDEQFEEYLKIKAGAKDEIQALTKIVDHTTQKTLRPGLQSDDALLDPLEQFTLEVGLRNYNVRTSFYGQSVKLNDEIDATGTSLLSKNGTYLDMACCAYSMKKGGDFEKKGVFALKDKNGKHYFIDNGSTGGVTAAAYVKTNANGEQEIIIAIRGTDTVQDLPSDYKAFLESKVEKQYRELCGFYENIRRQFPNAKVTFTGHSLGGGLSQLMAIKYRNHNVQAFGQCAPDVFNIVYNNKAKFGFDRAVRDKDAFAAQLSETMHKSGTKITLFLNEDDILTNPNASYYAGADVAWYTNRDIGEATLSAHAVMTESAMRKNGIESTNR